MNASDHYPRSLPTTGHSEPAPRRVRAYLDGRLVVDTTAARYVWEWPHYPQYYLPVGDVDPAVAAEAAVVGAGELDGFVRLKWDSLDAWFEEDEPVFVHPRDPYTRVDALRSTRAVRVELDGVVLASSAAPVMVFETGLPTRFYLDRGDVDFGHLVASDTETACPYKGRTSQYWSARIADAVHADLAWGYDFPTRELQPIAGLVAFYNEKVDVFIDGAAVPRPATHFS